jgi:hypothetical protein
MARNEHPKLSPTELLEHARSVASRLERARKLVDEALRDVVQLQKTFEHYDQVLERHELAVEETVKALVRDFGIEVDGMRGDFDLERIPGDARELVELIEFATGLAGTVPPGHLEEMRAAA